MAVLVVAFGIFVYVKTREPKPQIAFDKGTAAPDFTLQDENAQAFHLADQHGHNVVLIFYRGYW